MYEVFDPTLDAFNLPALRCANQPTGEVHELVNLAAVWAADGRPTIHCRDGERWLVRRMVAGHEADLFECWARAGDGWRLAAAFRRDALAFVLFNGLPETRRLSVEDDPSCAR